MHHFLTGLPQFVVWTDHNPLVPILISHRLDDIENPKLQHSIPTLEELLADGSDQDCSTAEIRYDMESIRCLQDLRKQATENHSYQMLKHCVMDGFPEHWHMLPDRTKLF